MRKNCTPGIISRQVLLGLLGARPGLAAAHVDRLRALAARVLLGLARDPSIRHILAKLQVCPEFSPSRLKGISMCRTSWSSPPA